MIDTTYGLAERHKKLRAFKKLSQYDLADAAGVSRDTIAKIETNAAKHPNPDTIAALAKKLGATYEYLMFGIESVDRFSPEVRLIAIKLQRMSKSRRAECVLAINKILTNQ